MKRSLVILLIGVLFFASAAFSQPSQKKWELGIAFDYSSAKSSGSSEYFDMVTIPLRIGYYFWKGFQIEPELFFIKMEESDAGYLFNLNAVYNFKLSKPLRPFVLAGLGMTNGVKIGYLMEADSEFKGLVINAGAGLKYLIGNSAALRLEYRFMHNHLKVEEGHSDNISSHQVLLGVSLLF